MKVLSFFTLAILVSALLFAGGGSEAESTFDWVTASSEMLPGVDPSLVGGDIVTAGSSTVFPLAEALGARFRDEGYVGSLTIDSIGSGAGFERFTVAGETDISNASRPIKQKEIDNAKQIGRSPIEFRIGTDALTVVISPNNTWADSVSVETLQKLFTADLWSNVDPSWPALPVLKFIPGTDSGTFDYFVEEVFDKDSQPLLDAPHIQASEDDNILVRGVEQNDTAIGFFGFAYYQEAGDALKALAIDGVAPNQSTVDAGSYLLARGLFMYSDAEVMKSRPQVAAFLAYVLNHVNEEIVSIGYFPAPESDLLASKQRWLDAVEGAY